ncbi:hypothetical protein H1R20_g10163, partial [Candolleomyces eurysporus]
MATGIFPSARMLEVPGIGTFQGRLLHSAQWDSHIDLRNKKVAVVGSGASAAQIVPEIAKVEGVEVTQFFRRASWLVPPVSSAISPKTQERFRKYPILLRLFRWTLYLYYEIIYFFVFGSDLLRSFTMKTSRSYVLKNAPSKYHDILIPDHPVGCLRTVFDVTYLKSLHLPNVNLVKQPVRRLLEGGLMTANGCYYDFDVIVSATGFDTARTASFFI